MVLPVMVKCFFYDFARIQRPSARTDLGGLSLLRPGHAARRGPLAAAADVDFVVGAAVAAADDARARVQVLQE